MNGKRARNLRRLARVACGNDVPDVEYDVIQHPKKIIIINGEDKSVEGGDQIILSKSVRWLYKTLKSGVSE